MTRIRSAADRAPQSTEAATALLERYAAISVCAELVEAARAEAVSMANGKADAELVPLIAERKDIAKQLQHWWEAHCDALTASKRKSIELGGCVIGYRMTPPKVVFAGGKDDAAVLVLQGAGLDTFVRVKPSPDKPAILKALDPMATGDSGEVLAALGFTAEQKEEFFVDRAGKALAIADAP